MIPSSSKTFLVNDLAAGREYDLCVLAVYDDGVTSLTATRVVGCVQFTTEGDSAQCHSLHTQFLGGTMIIIVGGIIVASVLVFIIILMIRYKVYSGQEEQKTTKVSNVYSQTNGSHPQPPAGLPCSASRHEGWEAESCRTRRDRSPAVLGKDCEKGARPVSSGKEAEEEVSSSPRRRRWSRTSLHHHHGCAGLGPEASGAEEEGKGRRASPWLTVTVIKLQRR